MTKTRFVFVATIIILAAASPTHAKDVLFESSDGVWADATDEMKGRDFHAVLWTFEHYKMNENKPDVTLVL